jgi:hypothetical protein
MKEAPREAEPVKYGRRVKNLRRPRQARTSTSLASLKNDGQSHVGGMTGTGSERAGPRRLETHDCFFVCGGSALAVAAPLATGNGNYRFLDFCLCDIGNLVQLNVRNIR